MRKVLIAALSSLALFASSPVFANAAAAYMVLKNAENKKEKVTAPLHFDSFEVFEKSKWGREHIRLKGVVVTKVFVCGRGYLKSTGECKSGEQEYERVSPSEYLERYYKGVVSYQGLSLYNDKLIVYYTINE